jgi:hypothetical protein
MWVCDRLLSPCRGNVADLRRFEVGPVKPQKELFLLRMEFLVVARGVARCPPASHWTMPVVASPERSRSDIHTPPADQQVFAFGAVVFDLGNGTAPSFGGGGAASTNEEENDDTAAMAATSIIAPALRCQLYALNMVRSLRVTLNQVTQQNLCRMMRR